MASLARLPAWPTPSAATAAPGGPPGSPRWRWRRSSRSRRRRARRALRADSASRAWRSAPEATSPMACGDLARPPGRRPRWSGHGLGGPRTVCDSLVDLRHQCSEALHHRVEALAPAGPARRRRRRREPSGHLRRPPRWPRIRSSDRPADAAHDEDRDADRHDHTEEHRKHAHESGRARIAAGDGRRLGRAAGRSVSAPSAARCRAPGRSGWPSSGAAVAAL